MFLVVIIFRSNRPMLKAVKYCSSRTLGAGDSVNGRKPNPAGNNIKGLLIGLALGFGCNGFCILMSVLLGDIYIEYSGVKLVPFVLFFICDFAPEEDPGAVFLPSNRFIYFSGITQYKLDINEC